MPIKKNCGRMESDVSVSQVLRELADMYDKGEGFMQTADEYFKEKPLFNKDGLLVAFIPESKNHNGKPMILLSNIADVPTTCLEISEEGMFAYYVDDGVS